MKPTSSSNARYRLTVSTLIRASPASRAATNTPDVFAAINRNNVGSSSAWVIADAVTTSPRALRPAYNRQLAAADGRTATGRIGGPDQIADLVGCMIRIADGASLEDVRFDADSVRAAAQDIRAYYEEAALVEHVPATRKVETWIYQTTETGTVIRAAAQALRTAGAEQPTWYYLLPANQA